MVENYSMKRVDLSKVKDRDLLQDLIEQIQKFQSVEKTERKYLSKIKAERTKDNIAYSCKVFR